MRVRGDLLANLQALPGTAGVARFDAAVDTWWQSRLRGKRPVDAVMYAASAAAEHSILWLALSTWAGWRRDGAKGMMRSAGRALALFGAESALVNGAVKSVFRRERPVSTEARPFPLRLPRTSSFPSGHASSAFFAAALLRDELGAPVCYGLACTVAASRVHVRIHHASDVVVGALVGAAIGELARTLVPAVAAPSQRGPGTTSRPRPL
ncbi:MAG TPA: phosphatase PAP2 family protein [Acidimicrobiales bacterium]|nr:phosphatase PAP2 family protein [Acidimicrobiales bacterium]